SIIYKELLTYNQSSESAVLNPLENNFSSMQITPEYENRSEDSQETITEDNTSKVPVKIVRETDERAGFK
ncbi:8045_t:CDS:2, partial [Dentiscutata erythropus]